LVRLSPWAVTCSERVRFLPAMVLGEDFEG
jgi:hypothetical protein